MKNDIKKALDRELQSVHVSSRLRARILSEAASARFPKRRRHSSLPALAAAAAVFMAIALLAGIVSLRRGGANPPDPVLSEGDHGRVWIGADDNLYHAQKNCGGILHTDCMSLSDAKAAGRTACPSCIRRMTTPEPVPTPTEEPDVSPVFTEEPPELDPDATLSPTAMPTEMVYDVNKSIAVNSAAESAVPLIWTSDQSSFYHTTEKCSGEVLDQQFSEYECVMLGKEPCTVCFPSTAVWMTEGGVYFHAVRNCSGMENASLFPRNEAIYAGKEECPVCAGSNAVWTTIGGATYHAVKCSSMTNAKEISEREAIASGKVPCTTCFQELWAMNGTESSLNVYMTLAEPYLFIELQGSVQPQWIEQSAMGYVPTPSISELSRLTKPESEDMIYEFSQLLDKGAVCGMRSISYAVDDLAFFRDGDSLPSDVSEIAVFGSFSSISDDIQTSAYLLSYPADLRPDSLSLALCSYGEICTVSADNVVSYVDGALPLNIHSVVLNGRPASVSYESYDEENVILKLEALESAGDSVLHTRAYPNAGVTAAWMEVGDVRIVYFTQLSDPSAETYESSPDVAISAQFYDSQTGSPIEAVAGGTPMLDNGLAAYRLPDGLDLSKVQLSFRVSDDPQVYLDNLS